MRRHRIQAGDNLQRVPWQSSDSPGANGEGAGLPRSLSGSLAKTSLVGSPAYISGLKKSVLLAARVTVHIVKSPRLSVCIGHFGV